MCVQFIVFFLCVIVLFGQVVVIVDGRVGGFRAGQTVNTHTHRVGTRREIPREKEREKEEEIVDK